jgi:hypothetical protein
VEHKEAYDEGELYAIKSVYASYFPKPEGPGEINLSKFDNY